MLADEAAARDHCVACHSRKIKSVENVSDSNQSPPSTDDLSPRDLTSPATDVTPKLNQDSSNRDLPLTQDSYSLPDRVEEFESLFAHDLSPEQCCLVATTVSKWIQEHGVVSVSLFDKLQQQGIPVEHPLQRGTP